MPTRYPIAAATQAFLRSQAEKYGGVGHGLYYRPTPKQGPLLPDEKREQVTVPCCIHGLAEPNVLSLALVAEPNPIWLELKAVGLYPLVSDTAFSRAEHSDPFFRLSYDEWATRLGVITPEVPVQ